MKIRHALEKDIDFLKEKDRHLTYETLCECISQRRIYILEINERSVGWLRYNLFWDNTPFMNLLYVLEEYRGNGYGSQLVKFFERQMLNQGFDIVMTSTLVHETALPFYLKHNYKVVGGFHPNTEEYEILLQKKLNAGG